jgi:hypothetical protein
MDVEGVCDLSDGFSFVDEPARQFCLLGVELSGTPEVNPPPYGRLAAGTGAFADQVAFNSAMPANTVMINLPA